MGASSSGAVTKGVPSFLPVALPATALAASLARWQLQGSGNLYTALEKRFFVPDPDLGWRVSDEHPIWLGAFDAGGVLAGWTFAIAVGCWLWRRSRKTFLGPLVWIGAVLSLAIPIAAFASGGRPDGAMDLRPIAEVTQVTGTGTDGKLSAPAGRYEVVAHEGSSVIARVSAGGEAFDARFGDLQGSWTGDPNDFTRPMRAELSVATASVDTGIDQRSKHAREGYLLADKHSRITFTLDRARIVKNETPSTVAFEADGTVTLVGKTHVVTVRGTISKPDAAALERLKLSGTVLRVEADLAIVIAESALAPDKGDFDGDRIPIHVSLVLRHTGG